MELAICEHPVRVFNKNTRHYEYVPCGKCDVCRNRRSAAWVERLGLEQKCWPYTVFFTLTYDEDHVPRMILSRDNVYVDLETGLQFDTKEHPELSSKRERKFHYLKRKLEYCSVRDVQLFMKRVRYFFKSLTRFTNEYEKVRYYIVSEYGSTTLRPHYHGLLFFKSKKCASEIGQILRSAWPLGIIDFDFARDAAKSYCAQYINSFVCLPKIYSYKPFRPFSLFSKQPPLGSLFPTEKTPREVFFETIISRRSFNERTQKFVDVPNWRYLENTLFPKCQGFGRLHHYERIGIYGIAKFSCAETFDEFKEWCDELVNKYYENCFPPTFLANYVKCLYDFSVWDEFGCIKHENVNALRNLFYTSNRVLTQCAVFGVTLDFYVSQIEKYYNKKEYDKLVQQMKFEESFANKHGSEALLSLFPEYVTNLHDIIVHRSTSNFMFYELLPPSMQTTLEGFGIDVYKYMNDPTYRWSLDLYSQEEYRSMVQKHQEIFRKSIKSKVKNDYLAKHPEMRIIY